MTAPTVDQTVPPTAARKVEFISLTHLNPGTELVPSSGRPLDLEYFRHFVRTLEASGFDYTLLPYASQSADSFVISSAVGQLTERLRPMVAVRPNTAHPLVVAQQLATLDQLTEGRAALHLITGGSDTEQVRQGDYLPKDRRYDRTREWVGLLRRAWTEEAPFDHEGEFYRFEDFGPGFRPHNATIPISIGGQSDAAFEVGGRLGDIFPFWGEPLAEIKAQIDRVNAIAAAAGRTDRPRIWVTFRPIIDRTEAGAWRKAYDYAERLARNFRATVPTWMADVRPQNVASQRALDLAARSETYDRALWTRTTFATNAAGASVALVGTPETVAAAILDYVDLGADLVSIRGYEALHDVEDYGRRLLPLVREELAHREATGRRGTLQAEHPGALAPGFDADALAGVR